MNRTPIKSNPHIVASACTTPINFSKELKQVLNERNLLTNRTRKKVCSMLDNINSTDDGNDLDKRRKFRLQAIEEILTSEKSYLKQLETLMNYFIIPLKERAIIDDASHMALFGQIEMIYNLNGELLNVLEKNLEDVASAFLKIAPFLKLYSVYAFDYKNGLLILQDLINKNPVFRKFLEQTESRPEVQTKLNSLMIVPIQRVPRYRLLLEQVLLYTSPVDHDYKNLKESVKQVELTVSHINSVMEDQEATQTLLDLQNSLVNRSPNIVKPSRKIIKEGILNKVTRNGTEVKRYCVLMSDIFMYCKMLKDRTKDTVVENSLECCCIFPLKKCKVYELFPGNFKITCQGDGLILCTLDVQLAKDWVTTLKNTIDLHIECRKTLRKESSKRTPMRKKDVKNFEANDILSPTKKKYDYESVFRCKSTLEDEEENIISSCFPFLSTGQKRKHNEDDEYTCKTNQTPSSNLKQSSNLFPWSHTKSELKNTRDMKTSKKEDGNTDDIISTEEFDPTYGFASRFSDSKTYFRTHNVDSTIPKSFYDSTSIENEVRNELMDILYPLRNNNESNCLQKRSYVNDNDSNSTVQKKRVKFDDYNSTDSSKRNENTLNSHKLSPLRSDSIGNQRSQSFKFENTTSKAGSSLLQRISNFFAKLF